MMKQMIQVLKPHLNKIGESLFAIAEERGIPEPNDVRIVITAHKDKNGAVRTFMQYAESAPQPCEGFPSLRTTNTLLTEEGDDMIFGIEQLATMLGKSPG